MKYFRFWLKLKEKLNSNLKVILIIVAGHEGSSPGKQGFKMFLDEQGKTFGTIGGGIMESKILERANNMLEENSSINQIIQQVHNKKAEVEDQSGLICAGKQWVLLVNLTNHDGVWLDSIIESYKTLKPKYFEIVSNKIHVLDSQKLKQDYIFRQGDSWYYIEKIGDPYIAHIFGGGHVGNAITKILQTLNFYIIQYETRENLEMFTSNIFAHEKIEGSFMDTAETVKPGPKVFVVVTTFSFDTDYQVLMNVLQKRVNYIGLMGSKSKIAKIFQMLRDDGFSRGLIDLIKAPIGLDISDGSVEEIAISVAAELIKIKNDPSLGIYNLELDSD
ncbi:MAG: XdhC family protein [Candidatus Kariarchaeaceae archaeon]|jgi:xanthine dehydrogenase accessory factor